MDDAKLLRDILDAQIELVSRFRRDGTILYVNRAYAEVLDSTPEALVGRNLWEFVTGEDQVHVQSQLALLSRERQTVTIENRFEMAAGPRWMLWLNTVVSFDADGNWQEAQSSGYDITERKQLEEQRELLIAELNHRVRNTLMVVQGMAYQTFKGEEVPVRQLATFNARLHALAGAHTALSRSNWGGADLAEVVDQALAICGEDMSRIDLSGPHVMLRAGAVVAVVLVLHELATNALKYGALSNDEGRIAVAWALREDEPGRRRIELVWTETGGPAAAAPEHHGFGSRLITTSIRQQLGGDVKLDFAASGLVCRMCFPLKEAVS